MALNSLSLSRFPHSKGGFTLVELSIVLVIIGLLIGGVLVGQSLISSAENNRIIKDVQQYNIAVQLFYSRFKALPGDYRGGISVLGASYSGNGDGTINKWATIASRQEGVTMFTHMSRAGVLKQTFIDTGINELTPTAWLGVNIPKLGDGRTIVGTGEDVYGNALSTAPPVNGLCTTQNYFRLARPKLVGNGGYGWTPQIALDALTPIDARSIDAKVDDGNASTGKVLADSISNYICKSGGRGPLQPVQSNYVTSGTTETCSLMFCIEYID
jgi:prepilin-type N-terminal cleavage/methylation domain-containing protein